MNAIDYGKLSDRELLILTANTLNGLCAQVQRQNGRIGSLEKWRWGLAGGLGVLVIIMSIGVSVLGMVL
jgi:hypothetical protein